MPKIIKTPFFILQIKNIFPTCNFLEFDGNFKFRIIHFEKKKMNH